ncbi:MAG TPA: phospholipase D family protein [Solirubrobacterales bacterium]|nr:phospholipase D family protein [Solirubrobacterales bacterium]
MRIVGGPQHPLFEELRNAATRHAGCRLQLAVAWVSEEGAALLRDAISPHVDEVDAIIGINNEGTTVEGMLELLSLARSLRVLYQHPFVTFHPKAYCFDDGEAGALLVGSSNLTGGGLDSNLEASLAADLSPDLRSQWRDYWRSLEEHEFCFEVDSPEAVGRLHAAGHVPLEATARSRRRAAAGPSDESTPPSGKPEPLPTRRSKRRFRPVRRSIEIPFEVIADQEEEPPSLPAGSIPNLFVRTLTSNDVAKLHGGAGTLEPDLGLRAREQSPEFWGWPDLFHEVVHALPRHQRSIDARLFSNKTGVSGVPVELVIWFREARPGHAAEFRFRPARLKGDETIVPDGFDENSVVVFERDGDGFDLLLVTEDDLRYRDYAKLLVTERPAHRYGYGP